VKKIGLHVVRGQFTSGKKAIKVPLFDDDINTGYKIVEFKVAFANRADINPESVSAKITTFESGSAATVDWDWGDTREIAWAYGFSDANTSVGADHQFQVIDPSNLCVEDVYISGYSYADQEIFNYMIVFEKYELAQYDGVLSMVRNRAE
jgi:hypothetical protein